MEAPLQAATRDFSMEAAPLQAAPPAAAPASRWRRVAHAALLGSVVAGVAVVAGARTMAGRDAGAEALSTDWSEIVDLFSDATGGVYLDTEFAQCYTGFCTKNGDGLTASCGCLSVRPGNKGKLDFGWAAAVLAVPEVLVPALEAALAADAALEPHLVAVFEHRLRQFGIT